MSIGRVWVSRLFKVFLKNVLLGPIASLTAVFEYVNPQ
jgi:hypothetical protein